MTKRKVLTNSTLYTISALFSKAIGFILLPVYTHYLTADDYGITNLVTSFIQVASFIVAFSLYSAITRLYTDFKYEREKLKCFFGTIVTFIFFSGCSFAVLGFIFQKYLVSLMFRGISFFPIIAIAVINITFYCLLTAHQYMLQSMQDGLRYSSSNIVLFLTTVGFTVLFIGMFRFGAMGVVLATLISNVLYMFYMMIDLIKRDLIKFGIDIKLLKEALKYSLPIMPHNLLTRLGTWISKIILNNSGSLSAVGLYGVATQFGLVIDAVQTAAYLAFIPWFNDLMNSNDKNRKQEIAYLSNILLLLYSIMYMVIGLFSQEVIILMTNEQYFVSWVIIPIFVIAYAIKSIYYFYLCVMFYYKKTSKMIFLASGTGSILSIILSMILIPHYGMYGASIAFLISTCGMVSITVMISKSLNVGLNLIKMIKTVSFSLIFMTLGLYFSYTEYLTVFSWFNVLYKLSILIIYLGIIYIKNKNLFNELIYYNKRKVVLGENKL